MKNLLLTIDDGPSSDTRRLVDFLKAQEIPVIMFFIGENIEKYPAEVDYAIQSGVLIGNHTYNHPAMSKLSLRDGIGQIEQTEKIIEVAYQRNAKPRIHKLFRFPFGDLGGWNRLPLFKYLRNQGFKNVETGFVTHKWFNKARKEPHVGATFHCWDWQLWYNTESFGIPDLLEKLHVGGQENFGNLFGGESGEILVIHDVGWKTKSDRRHYEIIIEELKKAPVHYVAPAFSK